MIVASIGSGVLVAVAGARHRGVLTSPSGRPWRWRVVAVGGAATPCWASTWRWPRSVVGSTCRSRAVRGGVDVAVAATVRSASVAVGAVGERRCGGRGEPVGVPVAVAVPASAVAVQSPLRAVPVAVPVGTAGRRHGRRVAARRDRCGSGAVERSITSVPVGVSATAGCRPAGRRAVQVPSPVHTLRSSHAVPSSAAPHSPGFRDRTRCRARTDSVRF